VWESIVHTKINFQSSSVQSSVSPGNSTTLFLVDGQVVSSCESVSRDPLSAQVGGAARLFALKVRV